MLVILFRSRLTPAAGDDYAAMSDELERAVRDAPGFVDFKSYLAADGERLTIVRWRDAETLRRWREDPRHREAQRLGRARWYAEYAMEVTEVLRETEFRRREAS